MDGLVLQAGMLKQAGLEPETIAFQAASGAADVTAVDVKVKSLKAEILNGDITNYRYYPCKSAENAGSGSTLYGIGDLAALNGTIVNGMLWTASGLEGDGVNQYIDLNGLLPTSDLLVKNGYYVEVDVSWDVGADRIFSHRDAGQGYLEVSAQTTTSLRAIYRNETDAQVNLDAATVGATMTNYKVVWDFVSDTMEIFINGVSAASTAIVTTGKTLDASNTRAAALGNLGFYLDGTIQNLIVAEL